MMGPRWVADVHTINTINTVSAVSAVSTPDKEQPTCLRTRV